MAKRRKPRTAPRKRALAVESDDPFNVVGAIPKNISYQWIAIEIMGMASPKALREAKKVGWKPVPSRRHPRMPSDGGKIVVGGQMLMQRPAKMTEVARARETGSAVQQFKEHLASESGKRITGTISTRWYNNDYLEAMGDSRRLREFTVDEIDEFKRSLGTYPDGYFVPVEIGVTISDNEFRIATEVLCIEPREYVKRRVYMDTVALMSVTSLKNGEGLPIFRRAEPFVKPEKSP